MSVSSDEPRAGALGRRRVLGGWLLAGPGSVALTAVLLGSQDPDGPALQTMLFLALAVACALVGGRWPALAASALGAMSLNYYFTEPVQTLRIASASNVVALVVFVAVSVAVASVVDSAARRREQASQARREAATLAMLNRRVLGGDYDVARLLDLVREHFAPSVAELVDAQAPFDRDDSVAPVSTRQVLVLRGRRVDDAEQRVLAAFATHIGVLGEREELARQTQAARELEAGNRTRTALLAAVSHDLRTPLAGIQAAAGTLLRNGDRLTGDDRTSLLTAIAASTTRLTSIVADLLDMSRLQTGAVEPVLAPVDPVGVLTRVLADLEAAGRVDVVGPMPHVRADAGLLERVLANLVGNALRHTDGPVEVCATAHHERVRLAVVDHGPGVADTDRPRMFEPFQQVGDHGHRDGVGLGLAVARGLAEAQGGALEAGTTPGGGLTMVVELGAAR
ncbi:sensor histidine kinase [Nocardioides renjunii]|uniref:sensor histidine kinase n=1 Tax=Nocardioides renjunii TaxID=3095075 RepID=UPI002AFE75FB|nr:DUF4118 domain-containing protein [Nocardioides sp. S-34]WQQ20335.1 DUF4118 domain-containing protein [Nocardioides sp. S-34]